MPHKFVFKLFRTNRSEISFVLDLEFKFLKKKKNEFVKKKCKNAFWLLHTKIPLEIAKIMRPKILQKTVRTEIWLVLYDLKNITETVRPQNIKT